MSVKALLMLLLVLLMGTACSSAAPTAALATPTTTASGSSIDQAVDAMLAAKSTVTATPRQRGVTPTPKATPRSTPSGKPAKDPFVIKDVKIYDLDGNLAYRGDIDLKPTFKRIEQGIEDPHPNDGSVFTNRERKLPGQSDRNYYHEYVVRTKGIRGVGPQRVILGKQGEAYYTPDHYATFIRVK